MKKVFILCTILISAIVQAYGQYNTNQNKVWAFGERGGLDFTSGSPVTFLSNIHTSEGCASVSDMFGHLLFYTDGDTVFTKTGVPMPSGRRIVPFLTYSSTQAAVIVQLIGSANLYYVFSMEQYNGTINYCHLSYCIVNMSLNSGLGDVIASSKGIPIDSNCSEKMIAVLGNHTDVWLITHQLNATNFKAYHITEAGLNTTPVVSSTGSLKYDIAGVLRASPDGTKIACQVDTYSSGLSGDLDGTELYDFDPGTGIVSNCQVLDTANEEYGAEFSPDNSKLFIHQESGTGGVYRYDLSLATTADIITSKVLVSSGGYYKDLKLAPDGKIYLPNFTNTGLDCITDPNATGTGWGYTKDAITLSDTAMCGIGLPNVVVSQWSVENVEENNKTEVPLSVFPNPAKDEVTLEATGLTGNSVAINCYNMVGSIVAGKIEYVSNGALTTTLGLSSLPKGVYEIRLLNDAGAAFVKTIVVQ